MKKVLIISYFFPPCNLTAAQRIGSWEKYFHEYGYYPIVITRNWTGNELTEKERLQNSGHDVRVVKTERSEIYYMPYKSSWRDHCFINSDKNSFYKWTSKLLTMTMLFLQNFTLKAIPYRNLYYQAREILQNDPEIECLIISGNPFEQFHFGYLLKKQFPYLKWIADYRDEWTTSEITEFKGLKKKLWDFQRKSELRWVNKANLITANTNYAVNKLNSLHKKTAKKLLNGFDLETNLSSSPKSEKKLVIVHNGTLYPTQKLDIFAQGLRKLTIPNGFSVEIYFPGIKIMKDVADKAEELLSRTSVKFSLTERVPKKEVLELQQNADVLLMVAHEGKKGIIGSKLYEYMGLEKNVLLCPSDNDEIEETLMNTNLGFVASTPDKVAAILQLWIDKKLNGKTIQAPPNKKEILKFTRKSQTEALSSYLDEL